MKNALLFLFALFTIGVSAQDFEGVIEFKKQEGKVIENTTWYVKGNLVRIDEFEPDSRLLISACIINTKDSSLTYINHRAKTYQHNMPAMLPAIILGTTVQETKNTKDLHTYKTTETTVKLPGDTVNYSYWMASGKFAFFKTAIWLYGASNSFFNYYWALEPKSGSMPLLVTKSNSKGAETGRFEVTRIEKRDLDANLFTVPADYKQQ
jgi:hypothetical protein